MPIKGISYLELWQPFSSAEWNNLYTFGRSYYEDQFCEFFWNLGQWFKRWRLKDFLSGALAVLLFGAVEPKCYIPSLKVPQPSGSGEEDF